MNLLFCTIAGLLVGGLAGQFARGYERNRTMDAVMGAAGGFAGGVLVIVSLSLTHGALIYASLAAVLGAVVMILVSRYVGAKRESGATLQRTIRLNRSKSVRVIGLTPAPVVAHVPETKLGL